ncbi:MAG: UDP-N-acetylmuramoyl-tripeptide--D-alanyl-D-alanine ligase [Oscillospiraceae bacterium]|nr:UDP-N-acetylmuramoyl-tripeptide--D-alanyl-D-alanine ligase [Oscillospiraceae bacterium]
MPETAVWGAAVVCFLAAAYVLSRKNVHIFQLNSYKPEVQKKWIREHIVTLLSGSVWALGAVFLVRELGKTGMLLTAALFLAVALLNLPKKAKVPLKFTARVKRLFASYMLIHAAVAAASFTAPGSEAFFAMVFSLLLVGAPWLVPAANALNRPMEQAINRRYIRQAEEILAGMPALKVIGVTGSYGKTSVKFFLEKLLSVKYNVLVTPENYNTTLGVVRTVRERLRATHEIFVCEMGARNRGDIAEICRLVRPGMGVITSVGPQHLESFGTIENVTDTKFELADALPGDGTIFLNLDNEYIRERKTAAKRVGYGTEYGEYRAEDIRVDENGTSFTVKGVRFVTRLLGKHNVQNICAAIAVADTLGISLDRLVRPVRQLESVPHRMQLLGEGDRLIVDDAYNSNPVGAAAALELLGGFDGCRVLVTPGMVELGEKQYELNRELGRKAAGCCDRVILMGAAHAAPIREGLLEAGFDPERISVAEKLDEAMALADGFMPGSRRMILLENDLPDNY